MSHIERVDFHILESKTVKTIYVSVAKHYLES